MKEKKSAVDVSKELIIDSIVLTTEVMHSIQNNLPIPLENVVLQHVERRELETEQHQSDPSIRILLVTALLALATVVLFTI